MNNTRRFSAVALKYPAGVEAPLITIKQKGHLAGKMVEIAREHDIPVVEDDVLENVLSLHEVGRCIPEETWQAVAGIFAFIKKMECRHANADKN